MSCRAAILLLFCGQWVAAQQSGGAQPAAHMPPLGGPADDSAEAVNPTTDTTDVIDSGYVPVPDPAGVSSPAEGFASDVTRSNYLQGSLTVGTSYDDNVLNSTTDRQGGFTYSILPGLAFNLKRARIRWTTDYSAGLSIVEHLSSRNQNAQNLGTDMQVFLSPHVVLHFNDHFSLTTGIFQASSTVPGSGVLQQPNQFVLTPLADTLSNTGTAGISYQFSAADMVGANANGNITRYHDQAENTSTLLNSNSYSMSGFYSHRLTPRNWAGVRYGYQHIGLDPDTQETGDHTFLLFDTIYLKPHMQLSVFGGPMYVQTTSKLLLSGVTIPISNNIWSGSGGASFNWQGQHNSISAEFARRVNDGGGIQGPSNETLINGNYGRQLTKTITIGVGGYYTRTDALITDSTGTPSTNTASGNITISKTFRQNFSCVFGYAHDRQRQKDSTVLESGVVNHNRGWINISYSFGRPLGR